MANATYASPEDALRATDEFYANQEGFEYTEKQVTHWLREHVRVPVTGRILDLCCGDGIWSRGFQLLNPNLDLYGIDISDGAIHKARTTLGLDDHHFVVGDAETGLPFADGFFDLIFARGPGLYNQHNMDRPATISVIEQWHRKLAPDGSLYSIFYSSPKLMGTYTPMDAVKLPFNRCPRKTETIDFRGGKYHHTKESFLMPFQKGGGFEVVEYSFVGNQHILVTRRVAND